MNTLGYGYSISVDYGAGNARAARASGIAADFRYAVIGGGGTDFPASEMGRWLRPLLDGMSNHRWIMLELDLSFRGFVEVVFARLGLPGYQCLQITTSLSTLRQLERLADGSGSLLVVFMQDYHNRAHDLLDSVADWLTVKDAQATDLLVLHRFINIFDCVADDFGS